VPAKNDRHEILYLEALDIEFWIKVKKWRPCKQLKEIEHTNSIPAKICVPNISVKYRIKQMWSLFLIPCKCSATGVKYVPIHVLEQN
jgi:hypothetical protein